MLTASIRTRPSRIVQSRQNARVKELRAGFAHAARTENENIAIEGEHLVGEAISSRLQVSTVFVQIGSESILDRIAIPDTAEILALPSDVFESAVRTEAPQGIAALVKPPAFTLEELLDARPDVLQAAFPDALILISAGLQDPGNLGTLIRSAEAFRATGFVFLPGTVSPYNQKALRASAGSAFRLPSVAARPGELFRALHTRGIAAIAAVASGGEPLTRCNLAQPSALILGNEGNGIPEEILRQATSRITIPTPGPVESLNAAIAGSILIYEAARQREAMRPRGEIARQRENADPENRQ
jgi:RNA methyltransferase, TrmH family